MPRLSAHEQVRLTIADTRDFATPGAGERRRLRLSAFGDSFLRAAWDDAVRRVGLDPIPDGVALAVVGSQARGDAGPLSDYDLVLLHHGRGASHASTVERLAEALWYPLWDQGVRFDHAVRTPVQTRAAAADELTVMMGTLDLRAVAGDAPLVDETRRRVLQDWRGAARQRLEELTESATVRHVRCGDITTSQAPHLKDSAGGLRDAILTRSLMTAWLADVPRGNLDAAVSQLLDVRDALHVTTGRGREKLTIEDRDAVAALLGYADGDALLTATVDAARTVSHVRSMALRQASQSQRARRLRVGPRRPALTPIGYGLNEHDGEIVLGPGVKPGGYEHLFRASQAAAVRQRPLAPVTLRNLIASCDLKAWDARCLEAFTDFLAAGAGLATAWEALDRAGALDALIPEWARIRSRPQHNAVHTFTVDRHSVETVIQAARLRENVARPDLLLIAALLHDIGKIARSRDHAVEGAPVARDIAVRLGLSQQDASIVEDLVRHHLTLIELATRRDPHEPATLEALAEAVEHDADRLTLLAALTEADARAAGEAAWSSWRAQLAGDLVARTKQHMRTAPGGSAAGPGEDWPKGVTREALAAAAAGTIAVRATPQAWGSTVTVVACDRPYLFADMVAAFDKVGAHIRRASIRTVDGVAVNTWDVRLPAGNRMDVDVVRRALLTPPHHPTTGEPSSSTPTSKPSYEDLPTQLSDAVAHTRPIVPAAIAFVVPGASEVATAIEVRAPDRPKLLLDLALTLARCGVSVHSAHIATLAAQSADTFYVTDPSGGPLTPAHAAQVIGALMDTAG